MKKFFSEFKAFISRGNVLDMAVGVIIATAFGKITSTLINNILMPFIGFLLHSPDTTGLNVVIREAVTTIAEDGTETVTPAIVLGFPLLLIASSLTNNAMSISNTILMLGLIIAFFAVLNVALFRSFLFKKKKK